MKAFAVALLIAVVLSCSACHGRFGRPHGFVTLSRVR